MFAHKPYFAGLIELSTPDEMMSGVSFSISHLSYRKFSSSEE